MFDIIAGILKFTIGLLCDKLRDQVTSELKDGEFTDEKCRQIIVRELDDIKTKLDGLSRKELLASISFFKEGVIRLYSSLDTSAISYLDKASTSKCYGATAAATNGQHDALERASELSKAVGNLNITSQERYKSAKKSFEESRKLATVAFNNEALSTEDRLLASKLRIASRILACLDDPEAAVRDCLLYLEELQNLASMQDVFNLWRKPEKTVTDHLRARFNKKKRSAAIESVRMMNTMLIQLAMNCTNITMGIYDWPTIEIAKTIYHPICDDRAVLKNIPRVYDQGPWIWKFEKSTNPKCCALTSKGEILAVSENVLELTRREECVLFYKMPSTMDKKKFNTICALDVDESDNVYIVIEIISIGSNIQYKLLTLDANGDVKADRVLEIIGAPRGNTQISVVQDGIVIIYSEQNNIAYICHSTCAEKDYKLTLPIPTKISVPLSLIVSNKNEIIVVLGNSGGKTKMYTVTLHDGTLKHEEEIPIIFKPNSTNELNMAFHRANQKILVLRFTYEDDAPNSFDPLGLFNQSECCTTTVVGILYTFSNTGELLHEYEIPWKGQGETKKRRSLKSHPNGLISLENDTGAIMFKT